MASDRNTAGYSLSELLVVVTIIGILVLIAVASFAVATGRAESAVCETNRKAMTRAVEVYSADTAHYPAGIDELRDYVTNWGRASKCPSGPSLTYNTVTHNIECPVHGP